MDLLGADELEWASLRRGVDGRQQTESAAVRDEGNDAEFDGKGLSALGDMSPEEARGALRDAEAAVERGVAAGAEVGGWSWREIPDGVAVVRKRRVVGCANAQRAVIVEKHRDGIAAKENVAKSSEWNLGEQPSARPACTLLYEVNGGFRERRLKSGTVEGGQIDCRCEQLESARFPKWD